MTGTEIMNEYKEDLRKHFKAKPFKHYGHRKNYVSREMDRVFQITLDRLCTNTDSEWFFCVKDSIINPFRGSAFDKCTI